MRHPPVEVMTGLCYGHTDVPLKKGWEHYAVIPDTFRVEAIYSSPLSRCLKLAQQIASQYQLSCQIDDRLKEFHFGTWEGKCWDDIPKTHIDAWAENPWHWTFPEGENGKLLLERVQDIWKTIKEQQRNILIVSHGGPLRLMRQIAAQKTVELLGELPAFGQLEIFTFAKTV